MTKKQFDALTKRNFGKLFGQRTSYRKERGRVEGVDILAERPAGRHGYRAALRRIGAGKGNSKLRDLVWKYERSR